MAIVSDLDIYLFIDKNGGVALTHEMLTEFDMHQTIELFPMYDRLHKLSLGGYLRIFEVDDTAKEVTNKYGFALTPKSENILAEHFAQIKKEKLSLEKSTKDHRLAMFGAITGIIGGATGLIALLMQVFR